MNLLSGESRGAGMREALRLPLTELAVDPAPVYAHMHAKGEVIAVRLPLVGRMWMTVSHSASAAMLKDDSRFTMRKRPGGGVAALRWWMPRTIRYLADNMLTSDEPDHRRLRKLVDQAFQRRAVAGLEGRIEAMATERIDRMRAQLSETGTVDLVEAYARPLPLQIICELLGLDAAHSDALVAQARQMTSIAGPLDFLRAMGPLRRMRVLLDELVRAEAAAQAGGGGGEGLIAELVRAEADGERLSHNELIAMIFLLLLAGHETTTHLISGGVLALLRHDDQRRWLLADPARYALAVEECLRFVCPVQFTKPRVVQTAGNFFGADIQRGDTIMACLGAANRDPAQFDAPDDFDLSRHPNPHLQFGTGIHFCLGFQLARLEMSIALRSLFEAFPDLALAGEAKYDKRLGMRALGALPVRAAG